MELSSVLNTTMSDQWGVDSLTLFVALLCACIVIGHLLEENRWINESTTAIFVGLCTGTVILLFTKGKSSHLLEFNEELFFMYLLPPIIFNAGFQVKKKQFFRNFLTINLFGVVGSVISFLIIFFGAKLIFENMGIGPLDLRDYLAIGAIFSATDSVCTLQVLSQDETPLLYSLVFGEGVVNDATAVVLFHAIQKFDLSHVGSKMALQLMGNFLFLFFTSTLLGIVVGLLCAYIIKKLYFARHSTDREVALMMLMAYLSYIIAELFDLSGILTVFFCGIVMSHYTWHNVTQSSRITTRHAFATLSFVAESCIFLYVGMDALDIEKWKFASDVPGTSVAVSSILFGLVLVGRASFIFPLSYLSNLSRKSKSDKINLKQQVIVWWAGLMRGAVSMALAYSQFAISGHTQQPGNALMITSTITVVLFSTVVCGLLTKPLITYLLPSNTNHCPTISSQSSSSRSCTVPLLGTQQDLESNEDNSIARRPSRLRMLLSTPVYTVHFYWRKFDDAVMRPMFGGRGFVPNNPGSPDEGSLY